MIGKARIPLFFNPLRRRLTLDSQWSSLLSLTVRATTSSSPLKNIYSKFSRPEPNRILEKQKYIQVRACRIA